MGFYEDEDWSKDDYPESWKPDTGDFVGGIVREYSTGTVEWKGKSRRVPICILEVEHLSGGAHVREGEQLGVWLIHAVLLGEFEDRRPKPGERIGIKKVGSPGPDQAYHDYVLRVDRDPEDEDVPDFGRYQGATSDHGAAPGGGDASAAYRPDPEGKAPPGEGQKQVPGATQGGGPGAGDSPPPPGDDDLPF